MGQDGRQETGGLGAHSLKPLGVRNLEAALAKAEQYRALNEPEEAESICRDILAEDPLHPRALRTLGLALTDMFAQEWTLHFTEAIAVFEQLSSEYEVAYYSGVAWERCAKAQLAKNQAYNAGHSLERALAFFEKAERLGPRDVPDPVLRWNRCVRVIKSHPEIAQALEAEHRHEFQHGD
jgi:tetratricopeptide (TPR) repeat protein